MTTQRNPTNPHGVALPNMLPVPVLVRKRQGHVPRHDLKTTTSMPTSMHMACWLRTPRTGSEVAEAHMQKYMHEVLKSRQHNTTQHNTKQSRAEQLTRFSGHGNTLSKPIVQECFKKEYRQTRLEFKTTATAATTAANPNPNPNPNPNRSSLKFTLRLTALGKQGTVL